MSELSIRIKIGDREYPMKVAAEEEERIRVAGKELQEKIKVYRDQFGIDDKQDLLAMVAFDYAIEKLKSEESVEEIDDGVTEKVNYLNSIMSQAL